LNSVNNYFDENKMLWSNCILICSDNAAAMTDRYKRFFTHAKNINPKLITNYFFSYHKALVIKNSDERNFSNVFKTVIEMIK